MPKVSLLEGLQQLSQRDLYLMYERWIGGMPPARDAELISNLIQQMANPFAVAEAQSRIYGDMLPIFKALVAADTLLDQTQIEKAVSQWQMPSKAAVDCLAALCRTGLVVVIDSTKDGRSCWAVPEQIRPLLEYPQGPSEGTDSPLALYGWLHQYLCTRVPRAAVDSAAQNMFQLLSTPENIASRLAALEDAQRNLLEKVVVEFGGFISSELLNDHFPSSDLFSFQQVIEKNSLGSVFDVNLEQFGLRHNCATLVVAHEIVLYVLQAASQIDESRLHKTASIGTDFVSSFSRFAAHLEESKIRFTNKGFIYKTSGKRIAEDLLLSESQEFTKFEMLELDFQFARDNRLVVGSGERKFILSESGLEFLRRDLLEKQRLMLDWMIEEYSLRGDMSHQVRMRRAALRFIKLLEPGRWYDAMHIPFVVRNHYFSLLTSGQVSPLQNGSFPVRASSDSRELSWNLLLWLRKDLHLLGIIDLAYDENNSLSAIKLSSIGCELLGLLQLEEKRQTGHLVVNPDFEIVLFPSIASHRLIYTLDCFCDRERTDSLYHFRLGQSSVKRALAGGFNHSDILAVLESNSPTPLPQNVCYELRSWANA